MMSRVLSAIWRRFGACFLAGLLALMPLVLTVGIVIWVSGFLESVIGPGTVLGRGLEMLGLRFASNKTLAYAIGWAFVLASIFVVGLLVQLGAKKYFKGMLERVLARVPLVGSIYSTARQLVQMFDKQSESEMKAMSVVFCAFGAEGGAGVLALMPSPERFRIRGRDYHVVLIPTAPVPFGGGLLFMPVECVTPADMSVDGLMSIYVSMGVTTPQFLSKGGAAGA